MLPCWWCPPCLLHPFHIIFAWFFPHLVLSRCWLRTIWLGSSGRDWDWLGSPGCWRRRLPPASPWTPVCSWQLALPNWNSVQLPKTFMHHLSFYLLAAAIDIFWCIIVAASTKGWPQCLLLARRRKLIAVHFPTNGSSYSKQHIDSTKRGCSTALDNIVGEIMTEPQVWVLIFYFWPQEITIWNDDLSNQTTWSLGRCIDHTLCLRVCDHQWTVSWSLLMLLLFLVTC